MVWEFLHFFLVIYYLNWKSNVGGVITVISNRLGDILFLILVSLIINNILESNIIIRMFLCIILIIFIILTKRAQFPFMVWLPLAIRAPTPISALVHSRTLVVGGVILLIIFYEQIIFYYFLGFTILIILITMFISSIRSLIELDFKKLVAYSTLRQISLLFLRLIINLKNYCIFHLERHALLKSLLFLIVGVLLHFIWTNQNRRKNNTEISIFYKIIIFICLMRLIGIRFLCGFFSKEIILERVLNLNKNIWIISFIFLFIYITFLYSFRLIKIFIGDLIYTNIKYLSYLCLVLLIYQTIIIIRFGRFILNNIISKFYFRLFRIKLFLLFRIFLFLINIIKYIKLVEFIIIRLINLRLIFNKILIKIFSFKKTFEVFYLEYYQGNILWFFITTILNLKNWKYFIFVCLIVLFFI